MPGHVSATTHPAFTLAPPGNIQLNTLSCHLVSFPHQGHNCIIELQALPWCPGDTQKSHSYRALRRKQTFDSSGFQHQPMANGHNSKRKLLPDTFLSSLLNL